MTTTTTSNPWTTATTATVNVHASPAEVRETLALAAIAEVAALDLDLAESAMQRDLLAGDVIHCSVSDATSHLLGDDNKKLRMQASRNHLSRFGTIVPTKTDKEAKSAKESRQRAAQHAIVNGLVLTLRPSIVDTCNNVKDFTTIVDAAGLRYSHDLQEVVVKVGKVEIPVPMSRMQDIADFVKEHYTPGNKKLKDLAKEHLALACDKKASAKARAKKIIDNPETSEETREALYDQHESLSPDFIDDDFVKATVKALAKRIDDKSPTTATREELAKRIASLFVSYTKD